MKFSKTFIEGVVVLESSFFDDHRGSFSRLFCCKELEDVFGHRSIKQINYSRTASVGAVRGMHYQRPPYAEMKVVRCFDGRVLDIAVDLRAKSPTFLQWFAVELSPEANNALVVPEGCAHGFQVLEPDSKLLYLHSEFFTPEAEGGVRFDDPIIGINWPIAPVDLSERDASHPCLGAEFKGIKL